MRKKILDLLFFTTFIFIIACGLFISVKISQSSLNKILANQNVSHFSTLPIPSEIGNTNIEPPNFWPMIQDGWNKHSLKINNKCLVVLDKPNTGIVEFEVKCDENN